MQHKEKIAAIESRQLELLTEMARIKEQIARAKSLAASERNYSDTDWYHAANRALKHKQIEHQELLQKAATLRKEIRLSDTRSFERAFMDAAYRRLDGEMYACLLSEARDAVS